MRRFSLWMRAHPGAGDGVLAALVLFAEFVRALYALAAPGAPVWDVVAGVLMVLPLAARRRAPVTVACVVALGLLVNVLAQPDITPRPAGFAVPIVLYTLVVYTGRRAAAVFLAAVVLVRFTDPLLVAPAPEDGLPLVLYAVQLAAQLAFCWLLGEFLGARRAYQAEVERRLRSLEFEQDQQARIAVAEERNRIARELHDVLAHSVSVMVTQADGAAYAVRGNPELAEQAVHTIGSTGRDALAELRSLLQVLRNPEEDRQRSPQPTAEGVRELVDRVRALGLPIELEFTGDCRELPTGLGLGVHRIVQESLTNVLKHAGWKAGATVRIDNDGRCVRIEVLDNGAPGVLPPLSSGGNGVIGMRERAAVYGGTLRAGHREGGGWRVNAELPLPQPDTPTPA